MTHMSAKDWRLLRTSERLFKQTKRRTEVNDDGVYGPLPMWGTPRGRGKPGEVKIYTEIMMCYVVH